MENILRIITVLYRKSQSNLNTILKKHNLTTAELPFFMTLNTSDGITQDDLSSIVHIDKSATARTLDSLAEKNYIIRKKDPQDKRRKRVFLTDLARELLPIIQKELSSFNNLLIENVDKDSLDAVFKALKQMEKNALQFSMNKKRHKLINSRNGEIRNGLEK